MGAATSTPAAGPSTGAAPQLSTNAEPERAPVSREGSARSNGSSVSNASNAHVDAVQRALRHSAGLTVAKVSDSTSSQQGPAGGPADGNERSLSRSSRDSEYVPKPADIIRSDGDGLEQPPSSPSRAREELLTVARPDEQPSTVARPDEHPSTSVVAPTRAIPAKSDALALDVTLEVQEDEPEREPPWKNFKWPMVLLLANGAIKSAAYKFCLLQVKCTCAFVALSFALVGIGSAIGLMMMQPEVETNFDSFLKTDVSASVIYDSWKVWKGLLADRTKTDPFAVPSTRRLQASGNEVVKDLLMVYQLKQDDLPGGVANENSLHDIALFEQSLRALPTWQELCGLAEASAREFCDPGLSFAGYKLASWMTDVGNVIPGALKLDGRGWISGWEPLPLKTAVSLAEKHDVAKLFFLEEHNLVEAPTVIRSAFRFKARGEDGKKLEARWEKWCKDDLIPLLKQGIDSQTVHLYYDGTGFDGWEVFKAMTKDLTWAAGAGAFVVGYLVFHTRSLILSILGIVSAVLSLPLAYLACALLAGTNTLSFASALMVFLIIGFGCDMILVYTDFWRDSIQQKTSYVDRVIWTYRHGGSASLATTAVTALSFFANLASVIRALRQIGFFMGLCISISWVLVTAIYVPLCLLDERLVRSCSGSAAPRAKMSRHVKSTREKLLRKWGFHLQRWRWLYFVVPTVSVIVGLAFSLMNLDFDFQTPDLFPKDHNRNKGKVAFSRFAHKNDVFGKTFPRPPVTETVCNNNVNEAVLADCSLVWCDSVGRKTTTSNTSVECDCFRKSKSCTPVSWFDNATNTTITHLPNRSVGTVRFVGLGASSDAPSDVAKARAATKWLYSNDHSPVEWIHPDTASIECDDEGVPGHIVMHDWTNGDHEVASMHQCSVSAVRTSNAESECDWEDRCYCSEHMCQEPFMSSIPRLDFAALPAPGSRRLSSSPSYKVRAIFGVKIDTHVPLLGEVKPENMWSFVESFQASHPWAQRNMNSFCMDLPPALEVVRQWCWIEHFRQWLTNERNKRFPSRAESFMPLLEEFLASYKKMEFHKYMWLSDDSSEVRATYFSFKLELPRKLSNAKALEVKRSWDSYLGKFNGEAHAYTSAAIISSKLWVDPQVESELLHSSIMTLVVLVFLAFGGMLVFTMSISLSIYVVLATLGVVAALVFFLVIIAKWAVGLVEGVALIYFIGYAVTYALHIAHKYGTGGEKSGSFIITDDQDPTNIRSTRTINALASIGGAALGSAATTAGAALFLCFCTLSIFRRLGIMCLAVTLCSILVAFGPLPAALLICGPRRPGRGCSNCVFRLWKICDFCWQRFSAACCTKGKDDDEPESPGLENSPWSPSQRKRVDASPANRGSFAGDESPPRRPSGDILPSPNRGGDLGTSVRRSGHDSPRRSISDPDRFASPFASPPPPLRERSL